MSILAYLLLLVVLLGMGTLSASTLPTRGTRIGLGAALFLAVIVDGTWFMAPLTDWSPALADTVWLSVFALIALGALASALHFRRAADQPVWTWPGQRDVAFLLVVILLFGAVVFLLPVPLDTDAQGFGYLALTLRDGEDYTTLAPWHPEIDTLYSPGYLGLIAHLGARFDVGIHTLELVVGAAMAALFVWMAYDLGCELEGPRTGRGLMLAAVIGTGLITAFMDSHYTALLALVFSLAFITFVLNFLTTWRWSSALFAAICLAAVPLSQPDTTIALMIGYLPWLVVIALCKPRPTFGAWLVMAAVIPLVALGIVAPWLISQDNLLGSSIESPFAVDAEHWRTMVLTHGGLVVLLAAGGTLIGLRQRKPEQLWMIVWLVGIVEFSTLGLLEETFPGLMDPLLKYDYPFSLAWHGPIIPYIVLGGTALVWLADRLRADSTVRRLAFPVLGLAMIVLIAGVVFFEPLLDASKDVAAIDFYGAFSSAADVDAMAWLRDNAPADARVLNHPGPHEGDWAPVISERDTVYFRPQPFFRHTDHAEAEQNALLVFWQNPADPDHAALLDQYKVRYVLVPQIIGDPSSFDEAIRWRRPVPGAEEYLQTPVSAAPYLRLVYEQDGAQVYELIPLDERAGVPQ
jgi:hypothetical protein